MYPRELQESPRPPAPCSPAAVLSPWAWLILCLASEKLAARGPPDRRMNGLDPVCTLCRSLLQATWDAFCSTGLSQPTWPQGRQPTNTLYKPGPRLSPVLFRRSMLWIWMDVRTILYSFQILAWGLNVHESKTETRCNAPPDRLQVILVAYQPFLEKSRSAKHRSRILFFQCLDTYLTAYKPLFVNSQVLTAIRSVSNGQMFSLRLSKYILSSEVFLQGRQHSYIAESRSYYSRSTLFPPQEKSFTASGNV